MLSSLDWLKNVSRKKLYIGAFVLLFFVAGLLFVESTRVGGNFVPLYTGLGASDKYDIIRVFDRSGVSYRISGSDVMVEFDKVRELRMLLASEGLPTGGSIVGYELFNKGDSFNTSSFTQNMNQLRALEGELSRTIRSFDKVSSARVHLVLPRRGLFHRDDSAVDHSSAAVILKIRPGHELSKKEITGIAHLVASAVYNLKVSDVTIVSTGGQILQLPSSGTGLGLAEFTHQEYKIELEKHLKDVIEGLIVSSVGYGKVKAEVSLELDFDKLVTDSEKYDPDSQVARSVQSLEEVRSSTASGGNVSVANNVPNAGGNAGSNVGGKSSENKVEDTQNFEISREKQQKVKGGAYIKRMSIAVLVDGTYSIDKDGENVYAPRDDAFLGKLRTLVASAVGLSEVRGDKLSVINMKFLEDDRDEAPAFPDDDFMSFIRSHAYQFAVMFSVLLGVVLLSVLVVRPLIAKLLDNQALLLGKKAFADGHGADDFDSAGKADGTLSGELDGSSLEHDSAHDEEESMQFISDEEKKMINRRNAIVKELNEKANNDRENTAALISRWLKEG